MKQNLKGQDDEVKRRGELCEVKIKNRGQPTQGLILTVWYLKQEVDGTRSASLTHSPAPVEIGSEVRGTKLG